MRVWWLLLACSCASSWKSGRGLIASQREVAAALGEPLAADTFDPALLPQVNLPSKTRPCCAFGMDLKYRLGELNIWSMGNVLAASDLGPHGYDNGPVSLSTDLLRLANLENNGLVHTCRGGFIDMAHVRDNADLTLSLAVRIVAQLPRAMSIQADGDGTQRRIEIAALPVDEEHRWEVATALAQWVAFQFSVWHEIATWYGHESVSGFSEKISAFTPEDLYSNALGVRIAGGIIRSRHMHSATDWATAMDAWIQVALQHLTATPRDEGRAAMKAVDGKWWDSTRKLDDYKLVTRRNMGTSQPVMPWRPPGSKCAALPLTIPQEVLGRPIESLVRVVIIPGGWAPKFMQRETTLAEFPRIMAAVKQDFEKDFGAKATQSD